MAFGFSNEESIVYGLAIGVFLIINMRIFITKEFEKVTKDNDYNKKAVLVKVPTRSSLSQYNSLESGMCNKIITNGAFNNSNCIKCNMLIKKANNQRQYLAYDSNICRGCFEAIR